MQLLWGSAVVSTAVFGVSPKTSAPRKSPPNGDSPTGVRLAGGTPASLRPVVDSPLVALTWPGCFRPEAENRERDARAPRTQRHRAGQVALPTHGAGTSLIFERSYT